jgi:D-sedoheptulose 7-phosphate isomerase
MDLPAAIVRKARESADVKTRFFAEEAPRIAECARRVAAAFDAGARLFAFGNGGSACDAQHVAVEFMHPIHEKRPALPAFALPLDAPLLTAIGNDEDYAAGFARQLRLLAREGDVALGLSTSGKSSSVNRAMQAARELGMLTVGFSGKDGGRLPELCDFCFIVGSFSTHRIQETHETLLHVLWDLVHVVRGQEDVI